MIEDATDGDSKPLFQIISGCSGGGKSTLIAALQQDGWKTLPEAGRHIVQENLKTNGKSLPWVSPEGFVREAAELNFRQMRELQLSDGNKIVFMDRSIVDLISYLEYCDLKITDALMRSYSADDYAQTVFVTPPWEDIFVSDIERPKSFDEAVREYEHLCMTYKRLGYNLIDVPKVPVLKRVQFLKAYLSI